MTGTKDARLRRRLASAEMWRDGLSASAIARALGVSAHTVYSDLHAIDAWKPRAKATARASEPEPEPEPLVVVSCAHCSFRELVPASQATQAFTAHQCSRPPAPKESARKRRRRGYRIRGQR
jgi:hypothetical protein